MSSPFWWDEANERLYQEFVKRMKLEYHIEPKFSQGDRQRRLEILAGKTLPPLDFVKEPD